MKFTLRDLFWLLLVVALAAGWAIDHAQLYRKVRLHEIADKIREGAEGL